MKLIIHAKSYSKSEFENWIQDQDHDIAADWIKELIAFTTEWLSNKEHIDVHTSGSTGDPTWMKHSKKSVKKSAHLTLEYFGLKAHDRMLLCLPTRFIAGKLMFVRAEQGDLSLEIIEPVSNPFEQIKDNIEFIAVTPHQLSQGLAKSRQNVDRCKKILIGGGPISKSLQDEILSLKSLCYHSYGMTETITHIAIKILNGPKASDIYEALPGVSFELDKEEALIINAEHLDENKIISNDIVKLISSTAFQWLGRRDHVINSGGIKLHPEQIEQKITSIIRTPFLIAAEKNDTFGEQLILLLEGDENLKNGLKERLSMHLTGIELPKAIYTVKQFYRTENGKIKRKEILRQFFKTKHQ